MATVLVPGLLMLGVALVGATRPVLSWDEIATADVAPRTPAQIWDLAHHIDGVFLPYYMAMHVWTSIAGDSVLSLRLPSILAMSGAVAAGAELGRRLFGPAVGLAAGILAVALPNLSRYAAEARPYAMACLFSTLSLLLLHRVLQRPTGKRWLVYGAAVVLAAVSHIVTLAALPAHLVILLSRRRGGPWRRDLPAWATVATGAMAVLSPLLWWGLHQRQVQLYWVPPVTAGGIFAFPSLLIGSSQAAWMLVGLLLVAMSGRKQALVETLAAVVVPGAVVLAVSIAGPSFWINRYLLFLLMPATVVAAAGLLHVFRGLTPRVVAIRVAAVVVVFAGAAGPGQWTVRGRTVKNGADYRTVAAVIRHGQLPGDVIVYPRGRTFRAGVGYYLRHDPGRPRDVLLQQSAADAGSLAARQFPDASARLAGAGRIWLVVTGRRADPATGRRELAGLLRDQYRRASVSTVKEGTVALYVRR